MLRGHFQSAVYSSVPIKRLKCMLFWALSFYSGLNYPRHFNSVIFLKFAILQTNLKKLKKYSIQIEVGSAFYYFFLFFLVGDVQLNKISQDSEHFDNFMFMISDFWRLNFYRLFQVFLISFDYRKKILKAREIQNNVICIQKHRINLFAERGCFVLRLGQIVSSYLLSESVKT